MRLISLLFLLGSFTLNCIALEVILSPYEGVEYGNKIDVYSYDDVCNCDCYDYEENEYSQDFYYR
jgi:hypothetical protein